MAGTPVLTLIFDTGCVNAKQKDSDRVAQQQDAAPEAAGSEIAGLAADGRHE
jgi:hypothetical protein